MKRSPDVIAMLERCTLKGWQFIDLTIGSAQCQYCHAHIVNLFEIRHDEGGQLFVGSECVKSFLPHVDGQASIHFLKARWRQHRRVYWKRFQSSCAIVGPYRKSPGEWWCAHGASVTDRSTWHHATGGQKFWLRFRNELLAQRYVMTFLITGRPPVRDKR